MKMSGWYWPVLVLKATFVLISYASYLRAEDNIKKLPFCNPTNSAAVSNDLVIVSTLDGRLTAFATQNGMKAWHIETQPLLSSNLHHVELTAGGKWVRLVPSLKGTLYSLSGDTVEPLPFDADQLLSSSFKYSDDLVIAGARETLWLGVDANSGAVLYECGSAGCSSEQQTAGAGRDVLVLRRHSSTVRALDPRSGTEKWNFSVAEHQLAVSRRECVGANPAPPKAVVAMAVALPEGVVAITRPGERQPLWQQKLEAPVAAMWRLSGGSLQHIDVLWEATRSLTDGQMAAPPSLYIGVHDTQLYVQESLFYSKKLENAVATKPVPWKLMTSRPLLDGGETALAAQNVNDDPNTLSLITLYGNAGQTGNHGFFLYLQETCDQAVLSPDEVLEEIPEVAQPNGSGDRADGAHHVHVHVSSLWFWWKEVLLIAISSALLMNLMIWPRLFAPKIISSPLPVNEEVVVFETHDWKPIATSSNENSRFENDFQPLRCLGGGGFGVVFAVKNIIDDRNYAVKRIQLPNQEEKRNRVLREVKALAALEHENIVRYFQSWVEKSSKQRQQERDAEYAKELEGGSALCPDDWTRTRDGVSDSYCGKQREVYDEEDSYIEFEKTKRSVSNEKKDSVINCQNCETESSSRHSRKKGHTRHYSIDMGDRDTPSRPEPTVMYLYIQMQLCERDSLHDWLLQHKTWASRGNEVVKNLFGQIVSAVEYVHSNKLIHRDLKPRNIFFAPDGRIKVGDFGLVTTMGHYDGPEPSYRPLHHIHTKSVGTQLYMSPEQRCGNYDFKVDIYSMGLILFELYNPFGTEHERLLHLNQVRSGIYPERFKQDYPKAMEVLKLMLSENPKLRPTASELWHRPPLCEHDWNHRSREVT